MNDKLAEFMIKVAAEAKKQSIPWEYLEITQDTAIVRFGDNQTAVYTMPVEATWGTNPPPLGVTVSDGTQTKDKVH